MPRSHRPRRPRHPLLHAQPIRRHHADLSNAGARANVETSKRQNVEMRDSRRIQSTGSFARFDFSTFRRFTAMAQRRFHYEQAFEHFLRANRVPYVAVDEAKKALMPASRG